MNVLQREKRLYGKIFAVPDMRGQRNATGGEGNESAGTDCSGREQPHSV